jgi:hypothetical protein
VFIFLLSESSKREMLMFFGGAIAAGLIYGTFKYSTDKPGFDARVMLFPMAIGGAAGFILKTVADILRTSLHQP